MTGQEAELFMPAPVAERGPEVLRWVKRNGVVGEMIAFELTGGLLPAFPSGIDRSTR